VEKNRRKIPIIGFILLLVFWVILAGKIEIVSILLGLIVIIAVILYNQELIISKEENPFHTLFEYMAFLKFMGVLLVEIVKANIDVAKIVLDPKLPISPGFVSIKNPLNNSINQVIYGNSITLTPGTLTVDLNEREIVVHALTQSSASALPGSAIEKAIIAFEEKK